MVRFWWQSYSNVDPEGVHHLWSTDVAWLQRGGKGGRHNNVTQLQYVAIMQNYLKHWIRCIIASADLPPATRHFRTWILQAYATSADPLCFISHRVWVGAGGPWGRAGGSLVGVPVVSRGVLGGFSGGLVCGKQSVATPSYPRGGWFAVDLGA